MAISCGTFLWSVSLLPKCFSHELESLLLSVCICFAMNVVLTTEASVAVNLIFLQPFAVDSTTPWQKSSPATQNLKHESPPSSTLILFNLSRSSLALNSSLLFSVMFENGAFNCSVNLSEIMVVIRLCSQSTWSFAWLSEFLCKFLFCFLEFHLNVSPCHFLFVSTSFTLFSWFRVISTPSFFYFIVQKIPSCCLKFSHIKSYFVCVNLISTVFMVPCHLHPLSFHVVVLKIPSCCVKKLSHMKPPNPPIFAPCRFISSGGDRWIIHSCCNLASVIYSMLVFCSKQICITQTVWKTVT